MNREDARAYINSRPLTDFVSLEPARQPGRYICPICGSGSGRNGNHTSAFFIYSDSNRVICYSNGGSKDKGGDCFGEKGEDTLGALRRIWNCSEADAITKAGYSADRSPAPAHKAAPAQPKPTPKPEQDFTQFYRQAHEALLKSKDALDYLHRRGIDDNSIERFNLGYCEAWKHSKAPNARPTRRIIIPRTQSTYLARNIDAPQSEWEAERLKQVEGRQKHLFNLDALNGAGTVFVVEGELDAISLYQAGAKAVVAIGTIGNRNTLFEEAKKHPDAVYLISLDNDKAKENGLTPGKEAQDDLVKKLHSAGLIVAGVRGKYLYKDAKDANEALTKDPEHLRKAVTRLQSEAATLKQVKAEEHEAELRQRTGGAMLDQFLLSVNTRAYEPIPTGISDIDRALTGGFIRGTLVTLGAPPAMGKTALAQWIFENMASSGNDVLYINLEMSREQLLARSISRLAWIDSRNDINALEVLRGYSWTDEQRAAIAQAAERYKADIAPHFTYNPDGVTNDINSILQAMQTEAMRIKAQGKPAPLVCIDYLQLIESDKEDAKEGIKGILARLKEFAIRENTVVLAIIANNRESNKSGTVEMESGRDTSAIEYSGDIMLGLTYTVIDDRRKYSYSEDGKLIEAVYDLDIIRRLKIQAREAGEPLPSVCNEISLKVLKNRFGEDGRRATLVFDGKHSTFSLSAYKYNRTSKRFKNFKEYADGLPFA